MFHRTYTGHCRIPRILHLYSRNAAMRRSYSGKDGEHKTGGNITWIFWNKTTWKKLSWSSFTYFWIASSKDVFKLSNIASYLRYRTVLTKSCPCFELLQFSLSGGRLWKRNRGAIRRARFSKVYKLFYSHIFNTNRGSLHTRGFRRTHLSVFRYRLTENGSRARNVSGAFPKRAPCFHFGG